MHAFDASDLLSPVLVKELRQGLRSRLFALPFMAMPGLLAIAVSLRTLLDDDDGRIASALFWACAAVPLAVLVVAAFASVRGEIRGQTYELMTITALSPWRIVLGKWVAVSLQLFLIATTVLPFVLLRYFLGGIELVDDLTALSDLLGLALLGAAVALHAGVWKPQWPRLLRFGCIGLLLLPILSCLLGALLGGFGYLLRMNTLFALNGALLGLIALNAAALILTHERARDTLREDRRIFWVAFIATLATQIAAVWAPLLLLALPLLFIAMIQLGARSTPPPLAVLALLPLRLRNHARIVLAVLFVAANLAWFFAHPIPGSRLLIAVTLIGSAVVSYTLGTLWDGTDQVGPVVAIAWVTVLLFVIGFVLKEVIGLAVTPPAALYFALTGTAAPAELGPALAIPALFGASLWYRAARQRNREEDAP